MRIIQTNLIKEGFRYQVVQFPNGFYGVKDTARNQCVSFGMQKQSAINWAYRLTLRHNYGV